MTDNEKVTIGLVLFIIFSFGLIVQTSVSQPQCESRIECQQDFEREEADLW